MAFKPGDKVRLIDDEPIYKAERTDRIGQEAVVLSVGVPGYESVKLKDKNGDIFYARPSWLRKPNQPDSKRASKTIKKEAAKMAEERMKEIMTKAEENKLPTFGSIAEKFYALAAFANQNPESPANDCVLHLAEKGLYEEIKAGCRWEDSK